MENDGTNLGKKLRSTKVKNSPDVVRVKGQEENHQFAIEENLLPKTSESLNSQDKKRK